MTSSGQGSAALPPPHPARASDRPLRAWLAGAEYREIHLLVKEVICGRCRAEIQRKRGGLSRPVVMHPMSHSCIYTQSFYRKKESGASRFLAHALVQLLAKPQSVLYTSHDVNTSPEPVFGRQARITLDCYGLPGCYTVFEESADLRRAARPRSWVKLMGFRSTRSAAP
jgi:hypothetical protein